MPIFWKELAGGTVGGVIGISVVYPLDTVKSRLQTNGQAEYTGMMHVLTSMARKEGVSESTVHRFYVKVLISLHPLQSDL